MKRLAGVLARVAKCRRQVAATLRLPSLTDLSAPAVALVAAPIAYLFAAAVALRRKAYDYGWLRTHAAPLVIVSVGGLEAGGSGKTPVTGALLQALAAEGLAVGLLTRGYRRRSRGLRLRYPGQPACPQALGDEAAMLVAAGCDVPVASCADRVLGAHALAAAGCTVAVMDDGFAHRRLRRDVDVVVLRAEAPLGSGRFLPWGTLRESPAALRRADVLWAYGAVVGAAPVRPIQPFLTLAAAKTVRTAEAGEAAGPELPELPAAVLALAHPRRPPRRPLLQLASRAVAKWPEPPAGRAIVAAGGTARPAAFAASLRAAGAELRAFYPFADHHPYGAGDVALLLAAAQRHGAEAVVVTAKDAVKLTPLWPAGGVPLWSVCLRLVGDPAALAAFGRAVARRCRQRPVDAE